MRNFLKVVLGILIVGIIGVLMYGGKHYLDGKEQISPVGNNNVSSSNTVAKEETENEIIVENNTIEEPIVEEKNEEEEQPKEEEQKEETTSNDEERAIELAKSKYGTTNGVYFRIEQIQSNNVYIVSVRDNQTTRDLEWYTVDIKAGTVR